MKAGYLLPASLVLATLSVSTGCLCVPRMQLTACQSQNRALAEQCRAQLAEIENLKTHGRQIEDQLIRAEEDLARLEEQVGMDRQHLANYQRERAELHQQFVGLANSRNRVPPDISRQLEELSDRYSGLHFDPVTGISKLQTDILFDSAQAELKTGGDRVLKELVRVLKSPEARQLKIMVAGHTDNQRIAKKPAREKYPNNFHLSAARALAVADRMRSLGLDEQRVGVAGFGPHQPIAPNVTPKDRQKNRRVEIFVLNRDVPVVGWTDSIPSVY